MYYLLVYGAMTLLSYIITIGERAGFVGLFQECTGLWTAGCWLARRLHQFKASTTMDLGISIFLISVQNVWP